MRIIPLVNYRGMSEKKQLVIGIVGAKGSGKGTVATYLREDYGAQSIAFSDLLTEILNLLSVQVTRNASIDLAIALRKTFGDNVLGTAMVHRVAQLEAALVTIDGIRYMDDYEAWQSSSNFQLISITAEQKKRYERIRERNRTPEEASLTWEQFMAEEQRPTEVNIEKIAKGANFHIDANGSIDHVYAQVDAIMQQLGFSKR